MAEKWMKKAFANKGALHRELGVPEDKPIPGDRLWSIRSRLQKKEKRTATESRTLKRVNLALRAKSGDISKMAEGGVVAFGEIFGDESPYDMMDELGRPAGARQLLDAGYEH